MWGDVLPISAFLTKFFNSRRLSGAGRNGLLLICASLLTAGFLEPVLRLSFIGDEAPNSYIDGWLGWYHSSWWSFYTTVIALWIRTTGRFMPLDLGGVYLLFHITH
jgi:hypothetical protein